MNDLRDAILVKEVINPVLIIGISIIIYMFITKMIKHFSKKPAKRMDEKKRQTLLTVTRSVIKYIILGIDVILILNVYGIDTQAILASIGVVGAVLGLAMQDLLKDIIAGISILFEDQFRVGDWIQIGDFMGEVTSLGLKTTRIKAYGGETKIISNRMLTEVTNYNMHSSMAIVDVSVSYEANLEKVEKVLKEMCLEQQNKIPLLKGKIELLGVQELGENGIVYRVVVPCKAMQHFGVQRLLRKAIKDAFDENNIIIPYFQVVLHDERV
ncbi:MAG: mechanosensitive ion channel family protein [Bacilli bacterium]|nr:mechanosensitive ion channel family protein [Bacilli bacterium]